jgi:putative transposase
MHSSAVTLGFGAGNCCARRREHEMVAHAGSINRDHVHILLSIPPSLSVSRAVQHLKGRSSHKLLSEFGILRKRYWG